VHVIAVEVANQAEATEAIENGANVLVINGSTRRSLQIWSLSVRSLAPQVTIEGFGADHARECSSLR